MGNTVSHTHVRRKEGGGVDEGGGGVSEGGGGVSEGCGTKDERSRTKSLPSSFAFAFVPFRFGSFTLSRPLALLGLVRTRGAGSVPMLHDWQCSGVNAQRWSPILS